MSIEGQKFARGKAETAEQIAILAIEYHRAAEMLLRSGRRGEPLSWAPFRLTALHAIELYLNAFLASKGRLSPALQGEHHFGSRARAAAEAGLNLRRGTFDHLQRVMETREYVTSRYQPDARGLSHLNRLSATLREVAAKATQAIDRSGEHQARSTLGISSRHPRAAVGPEPLS